LLQGVAARRETELTEFTKFQEHQRT
jgi:hypothetical protein